RYTAGTEACATADRLAEAAAAHRDHDPNVVGPDDAGAAAASLAASACAELTEVPRDALFRTHGAVSHALGWVEANEPPSIALDHAVDLWALSLDQARAGSLVNAAIWLSLADRAGQTVQRLVVAGDGPTEAELAAARARIARLGDVRLDPTELEAREDLVTWDLVTGVMRTSPAESFGPTSVRVWIHVAGARWFGDPELEAQVDDGVRTAANRASTAVDVIDAVGELRAHPRVVAVRCAP
ncbi:MAG: hypothetical protein ABMB14_15435, partial [Myxococcota bacterium]